MLVSASRRTDIPAFYSDWLVNRINAGYCLVQNPMNAAQIRRVSLMPEDVSGIVLWTKNAAPILPKLSILDRFAYYFQYTVTPYDTDVESGLASKKNTVIPAFIELASRIGSERVIWRYDPILMTRKYDWGYHIRAFKRLCELLEGGTKTCVVSFVIEYKSIAKNMREIGHAEPVTQDKLRLIEAFLPIAQTRGIELCACCELPELYELGIKPISCVGSQLMSKIAGTELSIPRDKNQRTGCNCAKSVDIGAYNSCMNGCRYCYANHAEAKVRRNYARHNPQSEMLIE